MGWEICKQILTENANITSEMLAECPVAQSMGGAILGVLIGVGVVILGLMFVALYAYHSFAWMTIGKKLKYKKAWFAWIPFLSTAMRLQLGGFHWGWTFLWLFPPALFILFIIAYWRIFEKRKQPGWFSLSLIIPKVGGILYLVAIGLAAWNDRK